MMQYRGAMWLMFGTLFVLNVAISHIFTPRYAVNANALLAWVGLIGLGVMFLTRARPTTDEADPQ